MPALAGGEEARRRAARRGLRLIAAAATGLLLMLAFPGPDLGPVAFVALIPLLLAVETAPPRQAAALGFVAGLVFFLLHIWWINVFGYLPLAALSLVQAAVLAGFAALVPATRQLGAWRVLALPACWVALELARAHAPLGGFPWGILGLTQHGGGPLLPLARVVGVYGLSAVIVAVNLAAAMALRAMFAGRSGLGRRLRPAIGWAVLAAALPFAGLAAPGVPPADGPDLDVVAVQGNVPGIDRADRPDQREADAVTFANHLRLTKELARQTSPDLVIWGEGAANDDPLRNPDLAFGIRQAAEAAGSPMLVGASTEPSPGHFATEALLYDDQGGLLDRYVKRRLVPFGEYVPGGRLMRELVPATNQVGLDKQPGHRLAPMTVDGVRFGVIACWESAYAEDARQLARDGARFLVVITNNSSWGVVPGSAQHLATSQLRAVEEGRTVVHVALSGISAVVGPDGVASPQTGLYTQASLRAAVPQRAGLTIYARFGRLFELALVGVALIAVVAAALLRRRAAAPAAAPISPQPQHVSTRGGS
jgi:apolipoprotein N-acyltransferase